MKNKILIGALAVAGAALLWSFDGTFLRPSLYSLPATLVAFLEHGLGFIVLSPFLIIYRKQLKEISKKQWGAIIWVALFGGALGTTFITKAIFSAGFHDLSTIILLQKLQPVFAIILAAILLKERFPKRFYLYALLAVIGGYFVAFKDPTQILNLPQQTYLVALFALLAAFSWGSSTVFGKYSIKNISYGLLSSLRFGLTVLILLGPVLYWHTSGFTQVEAKNWQTLVIIVFTSGALAIFLYYYGLKKIPASIATLCELAWPVSAIIFDYYFNHNLLSGSQIAGATLLIIVVYQATALVKPHKISGTVIKGLGQGEKTGMHTANLLLTHAKKLVKGLYTCQVKFENQTYEGLLYYGYNSLTKKDCLEVHLIGFSGDLYNKNITVITDKYLRLPKKFNNVELLKKRIQKDVEIAKD